MKIKTTLQIRSKLIPSVSETEANIYWKKEWVGVDEMIKELDKVWKSINTCKMDRVRPNFITKTQVAHYIGELRKSLTSNS